MTPALQDLHPDASHPALAGLTLIEDALDQVLAWSSAPLASREYAAAVARIERISRRLDAARLKLVAAADKAGAPANAGFAGTEAWVAKQATTTRAEAAHEVRLARDLQTGDHDVTAAALDGGLLSPAHAAVIVRASERLPAGVSEAQRQQVEQALVAQAQRFDPDQLRRCARRAIEAIEPDEKLVDAHEDHQVRTE